MCASPNNKINGNYHSNIQQYQEHHSPKFNIKSTPEKNDEFFFNEIYDNHIPSNLQKNHYINESPSTRHLENKKPIFENHYEQNNYYPNGNKNQHQVLPNYGYYSKDSEIDMYISDEPKMQQYLNSESKKWEKNNVAENFQSINSNLSDDQKIIDSPFNLKNYKVEQKNKHKNPTFTNIASNDFYKSESQKRLPKPIVIMNIEIGNGKSEELYIFEDDEPYEVAENFCHRNNLVTKVIGILAKNIEIQVKNFYIRKEKKSQKMPIQGNSTHNSAPKLSKELNEVQQIDINFGPSPIPHDENSDESGNNYLNKTISTPSSMNDLYRNSSRSQTDLKQIQQYPTQNFPYQIYQENISPSKQQLYKSTNDKKLTNQSEFNNQYLTQKQSTPKNQNFQQYQSSSKNYINKNSNSPKMVVQQPIQYQHKILTSSKSNPLLIDNNNSRRDYDSSKKLNIPNSNKNENFYTEDDDENIFEYKSKVKRSYSTKSSKKLRNNESFDDDSNEINSEIENAKETAFERLYKNGLKQLEKKDQIREILKREKEYNQTLEATFHPKINQNLHFRSRQSPSPINNKINPKDKMDNINFVRDLKNKQKLVQSPFKPEADYSSKKISSTKNQNEQVYNRLYEAAAQRERKIEQAKEEQFKMSQSFRPKLIAKQNITITEEKNNIDHYKKHNINNTPPNKKETNLKSFHGIKKDQHTNKESLFRPYITKDKYYIAAQQRTEKTIVNEFVEVDEKDLENTILNASKYNKARLSIQNLQKNKAIPSVNKPMRKDEEMPFTPEKIALKEVFETIDDDNDGFISAETVNYSLLAESVKDAIAPILFALEDYHSMNFEEFCSLAIREKVLPKIREIFGFATVETMNLSNNQRKVFIFVFYFS